MKAVDSILGEAGHRHRHRPPTNSEKTKPYSAYTYARDILRNRWPEGEAVIITSPVAAYCYAYDVLKSRWPEAEPTIVKDPEWAYFYAYHVIDGRWPEAEPIIANSDYKDEYLDVFPDAKDDWAMNGWIDWLDT